MSILPNIIMLDIKSLLIGLSAFLVILLFNYLSKKCGKDPRLVKFAKTIPGPPTLPLLGNSLNFYYGENTIKIMEKYFEKYGPTYRLWLGKHLVVGLSKPEDLEIVFMSSKMLGKPALYRPFQDFWGNGLFTSPVHIWKKHRKQLQPLYSDNMMNVYVPQFNSKIYEYADKMKPLIDGSEFNVSDYLSHLSFDIITKTTFDLNVKGDNELAIEFHKCVVKGMDISFLRLYQPWLHIKFISDLLYKKVLQKTRKTIVETLQKLIQGIQGNFSEIKEEILRNKIKNQAFNEEQPFKSFLSIVYEMIEESTDGQILMPDLIADVVGAGADTVALTNSSFLLAIAIHQDIQAKLYDEIYEVFGDSDRYADQEDLKRLPYLDQVLKETLRWFTLVPLIFRGMEEDCKIGDYIIPSNAAILISVSGLHYNPQYYPNPWAFNPENFCVEAVQKRHKLTFLSFSAGPRNCFGQNYAMLEMKLTLIALLRNFSFYTTTKMEDIKINKGYLTSIANGYNVSIKSRIKIIPSYLQNH